MTAQPATASALIDALAHFEDDRESRERVLKALLHSRVFVLLDRPWDGKSLPTTETRLLFVSDGDNKEQAMLAVFTDRKQAEGALAAMDEFKFPVEVDAQWALLSVPAQTGVRINPNGTPAFRILPELTLELRKIVEQNLQRRMPGAGTQTP